MPVVHTQLVGTLDLIHHLQVQQQLEQCVIIGTETLVIGQTRFKLLTVIHSTSFISLLLLDVVFVIAQSN